MTIFRLVDNHRDCPSTAFLQCIFYMKFIKIIIIKFIIFLIYYPAYSQEKFIRILPGYGLYGAGNIINSSGQGLDLIEAGINNGILYSPIWTPLIEKIGPIYRNPDFSLTSYSMDFQYGLKNPTSEWGIGINFFQLGFNLSLPFTYLNSNKIIPESNLYLPVTKALNGYSILTKVFQLELFYHYYFYQKELWTFFVGSGLGFGYGNLAYSGPYVQELHALLNLGLFYRLKNYELFFNIKNMGVTAKTGPSNFIDRRKVLVNPRRGEIIITSLQIGVTFLLTKN